MYLLTQLNVVSLLIVPFNVRCIHPSNSFIEYSENMNKRSNFEDYAPMGV
jgi:hypothetical protein